MDVFKNNIDFNSYKTFYVVAKCKSFSKASEELNISQPAVSIAIKKMEDNLDVTLFKRDKKGIELTETGKQLLFYVESIINTLNTAEKRLKEDKTLTNGEVRIGVPTHIGVFLVSEIIEKFKNIYPGVKFYIESRSTKDMLDMLTKREIDMPNILKDNESSKIYYECPAAKWFCEIYSDGSTTPCPLSRVNTFDRNIKWDNIREMDIKHIWDGVPFDSFRKYQKIGCEGCTAIDKCDRCPPQSIQWFNDPLMPPPYCIENGKNLCLKDLDKLKRKLEIAKKKNGIYDYGIKEDKDDIFKKIC